MSYLYKENVSQRDSFTQIEFQLDSGVTASITKGYRYDLTSSELDRLRPYVVLEYSALPATATPEGIYRIPVKGFPSAGDVPIWDEVQGAFVAGSISSIGNGPGAIPTDIVGGSNLIPNPSFHDGTAGYTAGSGTALTPSSVIGLFGDDSASMARTSSTGIASIVSSRVGIWPMVPYSASAWIKLGTLGTSTARSVTIAINWYSPADVFISTSSASFSEPINGSWYPLAINGVTSPDTAAKAEVKISVAGAPVGEDHYVDGFQLQVGDVPTNFGLDLPDSTIIGDMLVPETLTSREISVDLVDDIVAAAAAVAAPIGLWDFPYTFDPRGESANAAITANNVLYFRVQGKGTITKIAVSIGTADGAGTMAAGVHRNSGAGRGARPTAMVTSGSAATTPNGYREISLGASVDVNHGDWFSFTTTSATATFMRSAGTATNALKQGLAHSQTGGGGSSIPSSPGTLFDQGATLIMVGVA